MVENGIAEKDISNAISYAEDEKVRQSFLSKYSIDLVGIIVNIADVMTNLYEVLK